MWSYRKNPKNSDTRNIAVVILKIEQCKFTIEKCVQIIQTECRVRATGRHYRQMQRKNIFGTKKTSFGENKWRKKILL